MSDEKRVSLSGNSPSRFNPRGGTSTAVALFSALSVIAILAGFYWLAGIFAIGAGIFLIRIVKIKTSEHELAHSESAPLKSLRDRLGSLALEPALNPLSTRAQTQLERIDFSLKHAVELLNQKLDSGELAYSRFQAALDDAGRAGFAQLQDAVALLNQASLIGARNPQADVAKTKVDALLTENEKFLESLASATQAIATMETNSSRIELPQGMKELEQIATRAKNLSVKPDPK